MDNLRRLVRLILLEAKKKLITEPDDSEKPDENEVSVAANVAGATTPLGTGPTYPKKYRNKRKSPASVAGRSFGGAKPKNN